MTHWFTLFDVEYCYAVSPLPACSGSALSVGGAYWRVSSSFGTPACVSPPLLDLALGVPLRGLRWAHSLRLLRSGPAAPYPVQRRTADC